jgi:hypothetical protein
MTDPHALFLCARARCGVTTRIGSLAARLSAVFLVTCGFGVIAATARATTGYEPRGHFATSSGQARNLALDESSGDVYAAVPTVGFSFGDIEQFNATGAALGSIGSAESEFGGVAVDPTTADIYAYDDYKQVIDAFDSSGAPVDVFSGGTASSLAVEGGQGVPVQIATDSDGGIYYPNQALGEIQQFTAAGESGPVVITGLERPSGVAVTSTRIYVVDTNSVTNEGQVLQFTSAGVPFGTGVLGGGVLSNPKSVAVDSSGDVFVLNQTSSGSVVDEFDPTGSPIRTFAAGIGSDASGIAANSASGEIYVLETPENPFGHANVAIFGPSTVTVPLAETGGASGSEPTSETVTGSVNPEGSDTKYEFQYGTTSEYGSSTPEVDAGTGTTSEPAEATISSLEPNRLYHYRLVATNAEGDRSYGADREFTTRPASPLVIDQAVSGVTETDAVLEARINPDNEPTTYYFRYSPSPTLEDATIVPVPPGPEVGANYGEYPVRQDIGGGLVRNTTYYYQVVAINVTNATEGPIEAFTTLAAPVPELLPPTLVTKTTAALAGTVTTLGHATNYSFQYVSDADFQLSGFADAITAPRPEGYVEANAAPVQVAAFIGELTPDTTYHVRLLANNSGGSAASPEETFTTTVLPPTVDTGGVVSRSPTSLTVAGAVNPEGGETTYRFEYVDEAEFTATGYQNAISAPQPEGKAGPLGEPVIVTATLEGLAPETVYHYRLIAVNAGGATTGADESSQTAAEGSSLSTTATTTSPFGAGLGTPLAGIAYPDLAGLTPAPAAKQAKQTTTSAPSCEAKAKKIKNAKKRRAALEKCGKADGGADARLPKGYRR